MSLKIEFVHVALILPCLHFCAQSDSRGDAHHALKNSWMIPANSPWKETQVELTHVIGLMSFLCGFDNDIIVVTLSCMRLSGLLPRPPPHPKKKKLKF